MDIENFAEPSEYGFYEDESEIDPNTEMGDFDEDGIERPEDDRLEY